MIKAFLKRGYYGVDCTLGMLYIEGWKSLAPIYTLEEPWKNNEKKISCIPSGVYECATHNSIKFSEVWKLENVPERTAILIHSGNTTDDIEGCILVGLDHGMLNKKRAVLRSRDALAVLRAAIGAHNSFQLTID